MKKLKLGILSAAVFCVMAVSASAKAQVPVLYYDFENNTTRTTFENVVEQAVNGGSGAITRAGNTTTISGVVGAGTFNGGGAAGQAATSSSWDASTTDPGSAGTNYFQFIVNTSGFSQLSVSFDNQASGTGPARVGVLYSTDGTTFTATTTALTGNAAFSAVSFDLSSITALNNQPSVTIRLYAFAGSASDRTGRSAFSSGGTFRIDNLTVFAKTATASRTLLDYAAVGLSIKSGTTFTPTYVDFTVNGTGITVVLASNLILNGTFSLADGTLSVGTNTLTLNSTVTTASGSLSSSVTGTVNYNQGSNGQNVLASSYGNLTFSNFNKSLASSGTIGIAGTFTPGTATGHMIAGSTIDFTSPSTQTIPAFNYNNLSNSGNGARTLAPSGTVGVKGSFSPGSGTYTITGSTIDFNGSSAQTGPSVAFIYNNLTVSNSSGLTLAANQTVDGNLSLTGDITTSSFTLFMGNGATSSGTGDVVGSVNRGDIGATPRSFGNPDVQITESVGDIGDMTVTLFKGVTANDFANSVLRIYRVTPNNGTNLGTFTVRLHYLNSELHGNTESMLDLWRKDTTLGWQDTDALGAITSRHDDMVGDQNYVEAAGVTHFSDWTLADRNIVPTDVAMMNFKATRYGKQVHLEWQTGYEVSNVGFNIYREKNGNLERITPEPIAGSALIAGPRVELKAGLAYSWWDEEEIADCGLRNADCQYLRYWIEDIDLSGRTTTNGPFGVSEPAAGDPLVDQPREQQLMRKHRSALLSALGRDASLAQPAEAATVPVEAAAKVAKLTAARMTIQSSLASQQAVKLSVQRAGWYRVELADLVAAGLPGNIDPTMLQLFADGNEVPMFVSEAAGTGNTSGAVIASGAVSGGGGSSGSGGGKGGGGVIGGGGSDGGKAATWKAIEFYGIGIDSPSTANHIYWLVVGTQPGLRIGNSDAKGGPPAPSSFAYAVERRDRVVYFPALKNGGAEKWFGPLIFNAQPIDQSVTLQHVAAPGGALMLVSLQGFTDTPHTVRVLFNGVEVGTMDFSGLQKAAQKFVIPSSNVHEGVNQIQLIGPTGTSDLSLVDFVQVNYSHTNTADDNLLRLPATGQQQVTIDGFTSSAVRVIDVTDPAAPVELKTTVNGAGSKTTPSYSITVVAPGTGARTLLAFASDRQKRPSAIVANQPSNYRDPNQRGDYLIVTRGDVLGSFGALADLRKGQALTPRLIDIEDIYDEFSFGNKTPQALKDFLTYAKTSWVNPPRFVVLAGDATYDPKDYSGLGDFDLVPTRLVETAYNEAATDDWFADINNDGVPDVAIGRLPVRTPAEAATVVNKLVSYDSSAGTNNVLLVADRNSNFNFEAANTQLRSLIPPSLSVTDIRRGQLGDAEARSQLLAALNQGAKVVNYYGHGSTTVWTDAPILSASDAAGLTNQNHLSLVISMTCLTGYFHTPSIESLGESLLKAQGGAIAVWASSGLTDAVVQTVMSRDAISRLLSGSNLTIGEVVALAKASVTNLDVRRTWILLGDPATRLK